MSPVTDDSNNSGYETLGSAPANVNADQGNFQDKDREKTLVQALEKELHKAPWQKQLALGPINDLKKMTKTVKPIYEGFWYNSNQDILARLDQAARKLKDKRAAQLQDSQEDDTAMLVKILTMFEYGRGCRLGVFFDPLTKGPGGFSNV